MFEILVIALLILLNGVFAMSELAVVSARKARLQEMAQKGSIAARNALELANAPNHFLSTVQVGITLIGVTSGAFGGAALASELAGVLDEIDPLAPYADALSFGLIVALITYASLVIGELVPKRLALHSPERIASIIAAPMQALSTLAFPIVRLLSLSTNAVIRMLGVQPNNAPPVTEEEIRIMLEEGTEAGVFGLNEQDMVESVFRLDDRNIGALMTPHTDLAWLDVNDSRETIREKITRHRFSHLPVCEGSLDRLLGIVRTKDLVIACLRDEPINLRELMREPVFMPENAPASVVVERFRSSEDHVVIAIDEYGGIQGILTEHDILEAIVGDIPSRGEDSEPEVIVRDDGTWLVDGMMRIDEAKELLEINQLPGESRGGYQTLGGFVMQQLGEIPNSGQSFTWDDFIFEVVDMDGYRVDKVLVRRVSPTETD